jgi:DNA-binding NtrC family response regulator
MVQARTSSAATSASTCTSDSGLRPGHSSAKDELPSLLVGRSLPMRDMARKIERVVDSDVTVAIFGESGTGKELVARAIHAGGPRRHGPFVAINCAAIADSLQDSELFGHERGAFTGALRQRRGCFEQANGGTLFLDELGEMSASTQARLLRTLEQRTIRRVGGAEDVPIDVRIVCATRRDLHADMASGRFREDLYFRLVVYPIELPPLRERHGDVPLLVAAVLRRLTADSGRGEVRVHPEAIGALARYEWPGNVRELMNVLHRSLLLCQGEEITSADLPSYIRERPPAPQAEPEGAVTPLRELERSAIERALASVGGRVGMAAKLLGISRATLYRRMADRGIQPAPASR